MTTSHNLYPPVGPGPVGPGRQARGPSRLAHLAGRRHRSPRPRARPSSPARFLPWVQAFAGLIQIPGIRGGNGRILAAAGAVIAAAGI